MEKFDLKKLLRASGGEYVLGAKDTGSHACYMIYGTVMPGEPPRLINPGAGHEEIVLVVYGGLEVSGHVSGALDEGEAFHVAGDVECYLKNTGDAPAVYVASGGHSSHGHGH